MSDVSKALEQAGLRQAAPRVMGKRRSKDLVDAALFLGPFLLVYAVLLIYPFFKGVWISLHDWNLLAVAFNPDAKKFVGLDNYVRFLWGRNLTWSAGANWGPKALVILAGFIVAYAAYASRIGRNLAIVIGLLLIALWIVLGIHPGDEGRWYDRRFWPAVRGTFIFVIMAVPSVTITGLMLAIALNRPTVTMTVFRTVFFASHVLSVTVVTLIWRYMFDANRGLFGAISESFGMDAIVWLTNPDLAMTAIVIATVWWSTGFAMVLFLAGLQGIPKERYEAARLDGAGGFALFRHITLPGLRRTTTLVVVLQSIAHFQVFGQAHLMTRGGPNDSTQTIVRHIYEAGFRDSELGSAAAMSLFLFAVMFVFTLLQLRISSSED